MRNRRHEWLRRDLEEDVNTSALEELAKIPQELIDKEAAQKYIEWRFFKSEVIRFIIGTIPGLIVGSIALYLAIYSAYLIYRKGPAVRGDMYLWFFGALFVLLLIIIGYIYEAYDLYLRYKILKKNKEKIRLALN